MTISTIVKKRVFHSFFSDQKITGHTYIIITYFVRVQCIYMVIIVILESLELPYLVFYWIFSCRHFAIDSFLFNLKFNNFEGKIKTFLLSQNNTLAFLSGVCCFGFFLGGLLCFFKKFHEIIDVRLLFFNFHIYFDRVSLDVLYN